MYFVDYLLVTKQRTKLKATLPDSSEIKEIFIPMVMFFQTPYSTEMLGQFKGKYNAFEITQQQNVE